MKSKWFWDVLSHNLLQVEPGVATDSMRMACAAPVLRAKLLVWTWPNGPRRDVHWVPYLWWRRNFGNGSLDSSLHDCQWFQDVVITTTLPGRVYCSTVVVWSIRYNTYYLYLYVINVYIIRRPRDHPQHQATFPTTTLLPHQVEHRRVGRPRAAWTYETMKDCWLRQNEHIPFEIQNWEHREQIKTWTFNRQAPFWEFFTWAHRCCSGANGSHQDPWLGRK
jgi:hypothetical protein